MTFNDRERDAIMRAAMRQRRLEMRGEVVEHGRVEFLPQWRARLRVEYDFQRDLTPDDKDFLASIGVGA